MGAVYKAADREVDRLVALKVIRPEMASNPEILARFKQFADAGVTDLSVRLLPIGDTRDELVASKYRTREVIGELAKAVR